MNSNKQIHYGMSDSHQPPTKRGIWCFPYPFYDLFFCYHQWEGKLPKKYRKSIGQDRSPVDFDKLSDEESEIYWKERDRLLKEIIKRNKPTTFWYGGEFYSHISIHGEINWNDWFLWESVKDWSMMANKTLVSFENFDGDIYKMNYSKDHLEIFISNY